MSSKQQRKSPTASDKVAFAKRHGITEEQAEMRLDESGAKPLMQEKGDDREMNKGRRAAGSLTGVAPVSLDEEDKPSG
jgi:hypothetical protein